MKLSSLAQKLYEEISELPVIDAHEHLPSEQMYLSNDYSGLNMFAGYIWFDLESAGLPSEFKETMRDPGYRPVEDWWPVIKPFWEQVKNSSYAKALRITARDLFGIDDISDSTIHEFAEKVIADNKPGLYKNILQDTCNIRYSITGAEELPFPDDPGLVGLTYNARITHNENSTPDMINMLRKMASDKLKNLDDSVEAIQSRLRADLENGAVGFKIVSQHFDVPDASAAKKEFKKALESPGDSGDAAAFRAYLFDKALDVAADADVPVAVHAGYWGDFRELDPKNMFSFADRRRDVRFDMFHLGMPMVRDAIIIGKTLPNVSINLVWCPIISQVQTYRALDEIIDMVPTNKIIAFGGDYGVSVQKVYGHLVMAREVIAQVLADRVEQGDFDKEYAMYLAKLWFYDNPCRIYKLDNLKQGCA